MFSKFPFYLCCWIAATGSLLGAVIADDTPILHASLRKDVYLPYSLYPEAGLPNPIHGGRVTLVVPGSSTPTSSDLYTMSSIYINNVYINMSTGIPTDEWYVDWIRVEPQQFALGQALWISFHSQSPLWDTINSGNITINAKPITTHMTDGNEIVAVSSTFVVNTPTLLITWLTTYNNFTKVVAHIHNNATCTPGYCNDARIDTFTIFGVDVTNTIPASSRNISVGSSIFLTWNATVFAPAVLSPGIVWTAALTSSGVVTSAGGILFDEFYPIETWQKSSDCPFPTVNDTNYNLHRQHGVDTFFITSGCASDCKGPTGAYIVNSLAPKYGFNCLVDFNTIPPQQLSDVSNMVAYFLSDEGDTSVGDNVRTQLMQNNAARLALPSKPTYEGGSRNRYTGIFAGVTDIKGMDFYIAACAPHVTNWGIAPPVRGSYDYLRITRDNHAPLATWTYSQAFDSSWDSFLGDRQPNAEEIAVSMMSVIAAGAKGMMLFQTELKYLYTTESAPAWQTLGILARETAALRSFYRSGDITGMASALTSAGSTDDGVIVEETLSPRAAIITAINIDTNGGYSDLGCGVGLPQHWNFSSHNIASLTFRVPSGSCVVDSFEVSNATIIPATLVSPTCGPANLTLQNVLLSAAVPQITRTFVFAFDTLVRNDVTEGLQPWGL